MPLDTQWVHTVFALRGLRYEITCHVQFYAALNLTIPPKASFAHDVHARVSVRSCQPGRYR